MKKLLVLLLSLSLLCLALVGCGGGKNDDSDFFEGDIPEGVTIAGEGREIYMGDSKEGKERIKISYTLSGYGSNWLQAIAANFVKDNPQYWVYLAGDPGLTENVSTLLGSGVNLPDLFMPLSSNWQSYALNGWLADLEDVYSAKPDGENGKTVYEKMNGNWQEYCEASNKGTVGKYAYPWTETVSGFVYNATMFEQYGWTVPTTTAELKTLCEKILTDTNGRVKPFVYPGSIGGYFDFIGTTWWLQSSGIEGLEQFYRFESSDVFDPSKQPSLGKLQALTTFTEFFGPDAQKYSVTGSMSKNHTTAQLDFLKGNAAMIPNGNWFETEMKEDIASMKTPIEIKMMRTPYLETAQKDENGDYVRINYAATADYMIIPAEADNVRGAKDFLIYMAKDEMLRMFTKYTGCTRPFDYDLSPIAEYLSPFAESCIDIWQTSETYFDSSNSPLYVKGYAKKFITAQPWSLLVYGPDADGTTPQRFCDSEYLEAEGSWDKWVSKSQT